jgi:hypothetical protein
MARTIQQIKQTLIDAKNSEAGLNELDSPSQTAIWNLWIYIQALCYFAFENLLDLFKKEVEEIILNQPVGTAKWVKQKVTEFQFDSTNPQIVQLVNFVPGYDPVDVTKRIITRASVKTLPNKTVSVKVAKSEPPTPLTTPELNSLQGYLNDISFAGVQYLTTSTAADYLYLKAEVFYNGQYASVISGTTITAVNNYLSNIPFDGFVRLTSLVDAIQNVPGVISVTLNDVALRANSIPFASKTNMVLNNTEIFNKYGLFSGYVVQEIAPNDMAATLTFTTE